MIDDIEMRLAYLLRERDALMRERDELIRERAQTSQDHARATASFSDQRKAARAALMAIRALKSPL